MSPSASLVTGPSSWIRPSPSPRWRHAIELASSAASPTIPLHVVTDPAGAGGMFVTNKPDRLRRRRRPFPHPAQGRKGAGCRPAQRATSPCTPRHVAVLHASPQTAATSADCTQPGRLVHARCPRRWRWRKAALPLRSRRGRLVVPPAAAVGRSRSAPALGGMSSSSGGVAPLRTFRLP